MQPNSFDAAEDNFEFDPDKEAALLGEGSFGKTSAPLSLKIRMKCCFRHDIMLKTGNFG